ncbi:heme o synthase [Brumimicrobium aurantiacum]|uniref:Protoheme IX farnesyltransferase n=1 Tax=Brumimicrobium aurantiacum TaxID=1737063 RepID=A0A3E1F1K8_9FLAO|nr:heme o synthase [Brumimicrobium aurantiacum]RFC55629.1 protoheme IX farnesyltransferase [Brumimicrobium aurantiacum]
MAKNSKVKDYVLFTKFRLSFSVIISALSGFLFAGGGTWLEAVYLMAGGLLVTAASNGSNQIWERDLDKKMSRTEKRPLPKGTMGLAEAYIVVIVSLVIGSWMLYQLNLNAMILGLVAYVSYSFIYTPLKQITPWAVIVGAFPGAIPPMLGAIAVTNEFAAMPGALFFVQFVWQLPHFWAIAWVSHNDYQKAGFYLLPSMSGKSKTSAFRIALSAMLLIPFSLFPWVLDYVGIFSVMMVSVLGLLFFLYAYSLYVTLEDKDAKKLMFASFIYLPLVQFVYVIDKYYFFG